MNLQEYAKNELQLAGFTYDNGYIKGCIGGMLMELIKTFSKQRHSNITARCIIDFFPKLADYKPLSPLTGDDKEWKDKYNRGVFQNMRCTSVFKDGKNGKAHYGDAIIFRKQDGGCFSGIATMRNGSKIASSQHIKFPFTPKTFYIDVMCIDGVETIKDESQLKEVFDYYYGNNK